VHGLVGQRALDELSFLHSLTKLHTFASPTLRLRSSTAHVHLPWPVRREPALAAGTALAGGSAPERERHAVAQPHSKQQQQQQQPRLPVPGARGLAVFNVPSAPQRHAALAGGGQRLPSADIVVVVAILVCFSTARVGVSTTVGGVSTARVGVSTAVDVVGESCSRVARLSVPAADVVIGVGLSGVGSIAIVVGVAVVVIVVNVRKCNAAVQ
jgi:hypothetical protein